jgi:hypothetical protein
MTTNYLNQFSINLNQLSNNLEDKTYPHLYQCMKEITTFLKRARERKEEEWASHLE